MKIRHPRLNIEKNVPDKDMHRWEKSGWIAQYPPKPAESKQVEPAKK